MSQPYIGAIRMFGFDFAPREHAYCNGQLLPIAQNQALFSLLGTTYGGNGIQTFALPDLRGRVPIHVGTGAGLTPKTLGEPGGTENVTLLTNQLPAHNHGYTGATTPASSMPATETDPAGHVFAVPTDGSSAYSNTAGAGFGGGMSGISGGNLPHTNIQPYLCVNFVIALSGVFPSRN
jgi:microcystin-dependent protein